MKNRVKRDGNHVSNYRGGNGVKGIVVDLEWDPALPKNEFLCMGFGAETIRPTVLQPRLIPKRIRDTVESGAFMIEHGNADAIKLMDAGWHIGNVCNLMVMAWLLNENQPLDLESVVWKYLQRKMDKRLLRTGKRILFRQNNGKYVPIYRAPKAQLHAYCKRDVDTEIDLFLELRERLEAVNLLDYFRDEEIPYTRVLIDMERMGLPIDIKASEKLRLKYEKEHDKLGAKLRKEAGAPDVFNLASDDQVAGYLFGNEVHVKGKITLAEFKEDRIPELFWPDNTKISGKERLWIKGEWVWPGLEMTPRFFSEKTGAPSVSRRALVLNPETADHPWVTTFLEWQKLEKLLTAFLRVFPERAERVAASGEDPDKAELEGGIVETRVRSHYNQTGTKTGRLSSSDINLQQIPSRGEQGKLVRNLFVTHPNLPFVMGDQSQLETRLMAHFSQDEYLLKVFRDGVDPFIAMASDIYGAKIEKDDPRRHSTKQVWYAQGYGAMPDKMWEMITLYGGEMSLREVTDLNDEMIKLLGGYFEWREWLIEQAKEKGYVKTIGGRKRRIRFEKGMTWKMEMRGERQAANAKVQGSAADVMRRSMVAYQPGPSLPLCAQVHDEVLHQYRWKVNPEQQELHRHMMKKAYETGHGYDLTVPLAFDAKIATSWGDK